MLSALLPNEGGSKHWFAQGGVFQAAEGLVLRMLQAAEGLLFLLTDSLVVVRPSSFKKIPPTFPHLTFLPPVDLEKTLIVCQVSSHRKH